MLSKWQKFLMYLIGLFAMIFGIIVIIPFRAFWPNMGLYTLESLIKLIILPVVILLLSLYPNILKYRQIANYREQSKIVSFTSYFPITCYLIGLLSFAIYTLGKSVTPFIDVGLGLGFYSLWLVIIVVTLVLIFISIFTLNRFEMRLNIKEHIILDLCIFVLVVFYALLINKINQIYRNYFELNVPRVGTIGEVELLFIFIFYAILFIIGIKKLYYFVLADEINLAIKMTDIDSTSELAREVEYNRAYNAILKKFESSFLTEEDQTFILEDSLNNNIQPTEDIDENKVESFDIDTPTKVIEVVEEKVIPVDEDKLAELEAKKKELDQVKAEVDKQEEQIKAIEAELIEKEKEQVVSIPPLKVDENKKPKPKTVEKVPVNIIPSFKTLTNYAKSIPNITVVENEKKTSMRFMVGKKLFLIANETNRDYRLTFMYDLNEIVDLMIKYNVVVKTNTPKGPNWFKLVNKGDFKEEDLYDIIDKAHATLLKLEEQKASERIARRSKSKAQ